MKVTTKSGFKCEVNERILDDWRFTRAIAKSHSDDPNEKMNAAVDMVSLILGKQENAFYEHLSKKSSDGIVDEEVVTADLVSIISKIKAIKN